MSDANPPKRSLSEISHLFLSSVREKQTNGTPRPQRIPPRKSDETPDPTNINMPERKNDLSIDLTPEEFAQVFGDSAGAGQQGKRREIEVTAVLAAHLNGRQFDRVKEYARHLAAQCGRVGLIELDASEFRLMCFEGRPTNASPDESSTVETYDIRQMAEALEEMSWDIHRWLVLVPSPRTPEAKAVLRAVNHWVLLSTCDHDGIVSSYRLLKGLAEGERPRLSLALLDGTDAAEIDRVQRKLSSVSAQFLNWEMDAEAPVRPAPRVSEQLVLCCRPIHSKAQLATAPQWGIVTDFLMNAKLSNSQASTASAPASEMTLDDASIPPELGMGAPANDQPIKTKVAVTETSAIGAVAAAPADPAPAAMRPNFSAASSSDAITDVLDLNGDDAESILGAVLKQNGQMVECPVRPPMCGGARLSVSRDRGLMLLAVARQGLSELRAVGQAYRWMVENRALLAMALPQFAIDAQRQPQLRLLVDRCDVGADILQPMLESEHVTVQAYRRLRWGTKMGLFLEAA